MAKHFANNQAKAAAYAAFKGLEKMLKEDGELPPGFSANVAGSKIEIVIPPNTTVTRDEGKDGDGIIKKKATQNLYGWAILYECFRVCSLFKQHKKLERVLMKIVRRAVNRAISTQDAFTELMPKRAEEIQLLRDSLPVPMRDEQTPRKVNTELLPTVIVSVNRKAA
jgi:hypothetical protein